MPTRFTTASRSFGAFAYTFPNRDDHREADRSCRGRLDLPRRRPSLLAQDSAPM